MSDRRAELATITAALREAGAMLLSGFRGPLVVTRIADSSPVTEFDRRADRLLRERLVGAGEGWLSEETVDLPAERIDRHRVWIVDPLDGTQEFIDGVPEWSVSIGLVEDGRPVAGGVFNPVADQLIVGAEGLGVTLNGRAVAARPSPASLAEVEVLASDSEFARGEWQSVACDLRVRPVGSIAYKLALVAAGLADATWTLRPKSEWDVAGGAALVLASGGTVCRRDREPLRLNRPNPRLSGVAAWSAGAAVWLERYVGRLLVG